MIADLSGKVSTETLIEQLPFVEDATSEVEKVKQENEENIKLQQEMFKSQNDTPFNQDEENNDETKDDASNSKDSKQNPSKAN